VPAAPAPYWQKAHSQSRDTQIGSRKNLSKDMLSDNSKSLKTLPLPAISAPTAAPGYRIAPRSSAKVEP